MAEALAAKDPVSATEVAVEIIGLNQASATMVDRFAVHDKPDAVEQLMGH